MQVPLTLEQLAAIEANRQAALQRQQNKRPHSILISDNNSSEPRSEPSSSFGRPINLQKIQQQLTFDNEIRTSSSQEMRQPQQKWKQQDDSTRFTISNASTLTWYREKGLWSSIHCKSSPQIHSLALHIKI